MVPGDFHDHGKAAHNAEDFKVCDYFTKQHSFVCLTFGKVKVPPAIIDRAEQIYIQGNLAVFRIVPESFDLCLREIHEHLPVHLAITTRRNVWEVYCAVLDQFNNWGSNDWQLDGGSSYLSVDNLQRDLSAHAALVEEADRLNLGSYEALPVDSDDSDSGEEFEVDDLTKYDADRSWRAVVRPVW